ncbi:TetR/AcrR family transcriptional regulator [Thermoactinospora rubra]|uniref:TetR/AcrR family transcriptional regulator n=1 Tax=Thermoactinospora rubra TaxID=1088767 RepID=UPI000A11B0B0|nr:TetR family transcriptional regulator [Thermoactinospora rubra]
MAGKRQWLEAGLRVLSDEGVPGLTIERLAGLLGLTKGSFYHHFKSMARYKTELLEHFAAEHTHRYITAAESAGTTARARLDRLLALVLEDEDPGLEPAIRAWALQDDEVRAMQAQVDELRLDYLRRLWGEVGGEADSAAMASLLYLVFVGSQHVIPPVPAAELRDIYDLALRLAPGEGSDRP